MTDNTPRYTLQPSARMDDDRTPYRSEQYRPEPLTPEQLDRMVLVLRIWVGIGIFAVVGFGIWAWFAAMTAFGTLAAIIGLLVFLGVGYAFQDAMDKRG